MREPWQLLRAGVRALPRLLPATGLALLLFGAAAAQRTAGAPLAPLGTTINVTTTTDEYNTGADCSLREAIVAANTDSAFGGCLGGSGDDQILLPSGTYTLTTSGTGEDNAATGDLDLNSSMTIDGGDALATTVRGDFQDRVFHIQGLVTVTLTNLTIIRGRAQVSNGGGVAVISATVNLEHTQVMSNSAVSGGGVHNLGGVVEIEDSLVSGNTASSTAGGIYSEAPAPAGSLHVTGSTIKSNSNGGIFAAGVAHVESSLILSNTGNYYGLFLLTNPGQPGDLQVSYTQVTGNKGGIQTQGSVTVTHSLISANDYSGLSTGSNESVTNVFNTTVSGNLGPGIPAVNGNYNLYNVTISNNTSNSGDGGGVFIYSTGHITMTNTLIAGNLDPGGEAPDCKGTLVSYGYNLIGDTTGCTVTGPGTGDVLSQAPFLDALADNGGPTLTHALLFGSPAINAGNPGGCLDHLGAPRQTDQRDFPEHGRCDIGAFEYEFDMVAAFLPLLQR